MAKLTKLRLFREFFKYLVPKKLDLVVEYDALGAEVAVQHLDAVVQKVQTLAQLQTK